MMNLMEAMMFEAENSENAHTAAKGIQSILTLILAPIGVLFCAGAIMGLWAAHVEHGGAIITLKMVGITAAIIAVIAGLAFLFFRTLRQKALPPADLTPKERLNRNIMMACGLVGGIIGVAMSMLEPDITDAPLSAIVGGPIPSIAAIILACSWGIFLPILAYYWHKRAIDEQEAAAYRDGAYYAAYAYIVAAPTWWVLARGGLLPEPNGVAIFLIFNLIWLSVWFYKKYC